MKKTLFPIAIIVALVGILVGPAAFAGQDTYTLLRIFSRVLKDIEENYVDVVASDSLIEGAIRGMIDQLHDPHSVYLSKDEYEALRISTEGEFGGIGAQIGLREGAITVISPIAGTPASRSGLLPGDHILMVDSVATKDKSVDVVVKEIRGQPGTRVVLTIRRPALEDTFDVAITRAIIKLDAVPYYGMVTGDVGYVALSTFSRVAEAELQAALDSLFARGAKKIIFDLRLNSGGLLHEGVGVSELFLAKGKDIVATRGRAEAPRVYQSTKTYSYGEFPMITLVDGGSASAAEIVAGALQDWERSLIVGTHTFGKGSVQNVRPLENGGALKLTTARWYTPSGRCIDKPFAEQEADSAAAAREVKVDTTKDNIFLTLGPLQRKMYGKGGITPDLIIEPLPPTKLETEIWSKGYFFDFAVAYKGKHQADIGPDFQVDSAVMREFRTYLRDTRKMEFTDVQFDSSRTTLARRIRQEIFTNIWGQREGYRIRIENDTLVAQAVRMLKEVKSQEDLFRFAGH